MSNTRRTRPTTRHPQPSPHSGEGRELGLDDREIPGGLNHVESPAVMPTASRAPEQPDFPVQNMHGIEPTDRQLDQPEAGNVLVFEPVKISPEDAAVPVYVVERPGRGKVRREPVIETVTVAGSAGDPTRICSIDPERVQISLMNNDTANDVQFSGDQSTVIEGRGAILPHAASSYKTLVMQGELWALSTAAAEVKVSVIIETEVSA